VVEPDLMGEGAAPGALIERVDALAAETEALIAAGAFACLTMQE